MNGGYNMKTIKLWLKRLLVFIISYLVIYGAMELSYKISIACLKFIMESHTTIAIITGILIGIICSFTVKK